MISRRNRQSGFTLVEMVVAISLSTLLLGVTAVWIHQSLNFASEMKRRQHQHVNLNRLATQLRDDIQACQRMQLDGAENLLLYGSEKEVIRYSIEHPSIVYEKLDGQKIISRDRFRLSDRSIATWDAGESPEQISLLIYRMPTGSYALAEDSKIENIALEKLPIELHVRASSGRWRSTQRGDSP